MLNKVILMGRITQDLEVKQTPSGVSVLSFTVAVQRSFARQGEERQTDFINCVAWRQQAEFIGRYFRKGRMIAIEGISEQEHMTTKTVLKHYVTEVYVDNVSFTGEKAEGGYQQNDYNNGYQNNNYNQTAQQNNYNSAPSNNDLSIGDMADFEVLSDDGVPF